jgi:hypothetical protein
MAKICLKMKLSLKERNVGVRQQFIVDETGAKLPSLTCFASLVTLRCWGSLGNAKRFRARRTLD